MSCCNADLLENTYTAPPHTVPTVRAGYFWYDQH